MCKSMCLFSKAQYVEGIQSKGGIAQPGVAIIPIAHPSQFFGQRGGGSRHNSPSGRIGQHFEHQCTAFDPGIISSFVGAARKPGTPPVQGMSQLPVEIA